MMKLTSKGKKNIVHNCDECSWQGFASRGLQAWPLEERLGLPMLGTTGFRLGPVNPLWDKAKSLKKDGGASM